MANVTTLYDTVPHDPDKITWNASMVPLAFDRATRPFIDCVARPDGKPGRKCTYITTEITDQHQLGVLDRLFGTNPENREQLALLVRRLAMTYSVNGSREPGFDGSILEVRCPEMVDPATMRKRRMDTCGRWRRQDAGGDKVREMIDLYYADRSKEILDNLTREFCKVSWHSDVEDCACINRANDPDYARLVSKNGALQAEDHCWYLPCKSGAFLYDPDQPRGPCHLSVCQVVTNIEAQGNVTIDRTKVDVTGCTTEVQAPPRPVEGSMERPPAERLPPPARPPPASEEEKEPAWQRWMSGNLAPLAILAGALLVSFVFHGRRRSRRRSH